MSSSAIVEDLDVLKHLFPQLCFNEPIDYIDPGGEESTGEELGNFITGVGDRASGGLTRDIRNVVGIGEPDTSSGAYQAGGDAGIGLALLIPGDEEVGALDAAGESQSWLGHLSAWGSDEGGEFDPLAQFRRPSDTKETIGDARQSLDEAGEFVDKLNSTTQPPDQATGGGRIVRFLAQVGRLLHHPPE